MLDEAAKALISYGALGVVALAAIAAAVYLYRDAKAERERNRAAEAALVDRFVAKAESWTTRYHELAESQVKSLDAQQSLMERVEALLERALFPRDPRGGG